MAKIITNTDPALGETVFNCNPNLTHYVIPVHDPLWFDFRTTGALGYEGLAGASEIGKFMQIEPEKYSPVLPEVIEEKAGLRPVSRRFTPAMMAGIMHEPTILKMWQYFDGTSDGYCTNFLADDKKRTFGTIGAYIVNKNYPWLFCSLDAKILKDNPTLSGEVLTEDSPLECKTIGFQAARSYEHGIPLGYVFQIQTQMMITETGYAEMAILEAGRDFKVEWFESNLEVQTQIIERTYHYWRLLLEIKELKQERDAYLAQGKTSQANHVHDVIQNKLPLPIAGEGYDSYYTSKHDPKEDDAYIKGTTEHYKLIRRRLKYLAMSGLYQDKVDEIDNIFRDVFVKNKVNIIDFDNAGKVKFVKRSNGKNYFPDYKSIKEKVDEFAMKQIFNNHLKDV